MTSGNYYPDMRTDWHTHLFKCQGFTYLWVLFTVAFLGLSMMLTAELWLTSVKREREQELIFIGRQFRDAIRRYHEATPNSIQKQYPLSLDDLLNDSRYATPRRYLRKIYQDPMTQKAEWGILRLGGRIVGVYSLSDEAPLKKAGFSQLEAGFQGQSTYSAWVFTYPSHLIVREERKPAAEGSGFGASSSVQLQKLPDSSKELKNDIYRK